MRVHVKCGKVAEPIQPRPHCRLFRRQVMNIRSSGEMAFRQSVSLWLMNGPTLTHHSRPGTSGRCSCCPSTVLRSRQKLVGNLSMNAYTQHGLCLGRRRRPTTLADTAVLYRCQMRYHHYPVVQW